MENKDTAISASERLMPYLTILLGACILSFGIYNIHSRCQITEGGELGMELLLRYWFGISPALTALVLDAVCYAVGIRVLGRRFIPYAAAATICYSLSYTLWEHFPPLLPDLSACPPVACLLGGLFVGTGCGLVARIGGACSGDDALALVISRKSGKNVGLCYLLTDTVVLAASLSYLPLQQVLWSLLTVVTSSAVITLIQRIPSPKNLTMNEFSGD